MDAYVVSTVAMALAVLSVAGEIVPEDLRWSALLAGVALLVYRITVEDPRASGLDRVLGDRSTLDELDINECLRHARVLWLYAPTGINFLTPERCDIIRTSILTRDDAVVRIVVLDPDSGPPVDLAAQQLDDAISYPIQRLRPSLTAILDRLERILRWQVRGIFDYRLIRYNPGFSLLVIDPYSINGIVVVELHGFHQESVGTRMHLALTRSDADRWFAHWVDQFNHIWRASRMPSCEE